MDEGLLNDLLECSVCLERLDTSSRVLPCQHTFCIKCLKEIVQSHKELRCPECRILVEVPVEDLPPNVLLMRILEGMRGRGGAGNNSTPSKPSLNQSQLISTPINPSLHQQKPMMPYNHNVPKRQQKDGSNIMQYQDPSNFGISRVGASQSQQHAGRMQHDPGRQHTEFAVNNTTPYARAVYDYLSKDPGNLSFKKGDIVLLKRRIDAHWFYGEHGGKQGAFPISCVQVIVPLPTPQCKALYDFRMAAPDEDGCLAFDKGAVITVIRRVDENWAEGRLSERIGIFPIAFVEMNSSARALMKISNNVGNRLASTVPHGEPATAANMLQPNRVDQQVPNAHRQQQMSVSSPAPALGPTPPGAHPMSQSQPLLSNHHFQQSHIPTNATQQSSSVTQEPDPQSEPDLIQLVYGSHANAAQILVQNLQAANSNKHNNPEANTQVNLAAQEAFQKARANIKQFQSLSSSYHAANNLGSDSSSSTTTPSFGGSSITTTPNTSSSNTSSSESNTPSSPASPATNIQARNNVEKNTTGQASQSAVQNSYCNVVPVPKQPNTQPSTGMYTATIEDPNTSNRSHDSSVESSGKNSVLNTSNHSLLNSDATTRINISNSSPVQNVTVESPPRSIMSSPQTFNMGTVTGISNTIVHSHSEMKCAQQSAAGIYQVPLNNREIMQYSNSGYTLLTNTQSGSISNPFLANTNVDSSTQNDDHTSLVSPRHGRDGVIVNTARTGYQSHHHNREKRHSLTPGGQTLAPQPNATVNRHSMEYMLPGNNISPVTPRTGPALPAEGQSTQLFTEGIRKSESKRDRDKEVKLPAPYVALYPYKPQKGDELELKKGATYMVMERCYDGWYKGCLNGNPQKCGVFPGNYVAPAHSKSKHRSSKNSSSANGQTSSSKSASNSSGFSAPAGARKIDGTSSDVSTAQSPSTATSTSQSAQPPDLPPRSASPTNSSFPWSTSKASSSSSSKSSEMSKEKHKSEKTHTSMSFMKRLAGMKKSRSPPPSSSNSGQGHGFSMDNPVFEDCSVPASQQPVHVRSGSCPSQLLQPENIVEASPTGPHATVGPTGAARLINSSKAAHTLGPANAMGPRARNRPSLANATLTAPSQQVAQRSTGDGPWHPITSASNNRPQHQHRKSHSLDAGQQLRTKDSTTTRERYRCIVPYPPNSEYELELQLDDVVVVHRKWGDGWYKGTHERTRKTGLFPASFVEAC